MTKKTRAKFSYVPDAKGVVIHQYLGNPQEVPQSLGLEIIDGFSRCSKADSFYDTPWRKFNFYSLSLLCKGRGILQIRNQPEQIVDPGDLVLITPGCENRYGAAFHQIYAEETLLFRGELVDRFTAAGAILPGKYPGLEPGLFSEILALAFNPAHSRKIQAAYRLLELLSRLYDDRLTQNTDCMDEILQKILHNPLKWWTVKELCSITHLHPNHFRQLFIQRTGVTPKHYIEELKLRTAAHLLLQDQQADIQKIASLCGYQDKYHFARRFKQFFNISPGHYRKHIISDYALDER